MDIPNCITQRPEAANARKRLGDWEADTVLSRQGGACLLTLVDRMSRYLLCRRLDRKGSEETAQEMRSALQGQPVQDELNFCPRKSLGFKIPAEVYFHKSLHLT